MFCSVFTFARLPRIGQKFMKKNANCMCFYKKERQPNANRCSAKLLPFLDVNKNKDVEVSFRSFWAILSQLKPPKRKFLRFFKWILFLRHQTTLLDENGLEYSWLPKEHGDMLINFLGNVHRNTLIWQQHGHGFFHKNIKTEIKGRDWICRISSAFALCIAQV